MRHHDPSIPRGSQTDAGDWMLLVLMGVGFGIGSALFATGAVLVWADRNDDVANLVFVVGALFFTAAAAVQWRSAIVHQPGFDRLRSHAMWDITNPDWLSAVIQFIGTLWFNVMTITALAIGLNRGDATYQDVWGPDALGSILFLVSSLIAFDQTVRQRRHRLIAKRSAYICYANLVGSILFGVSALGAMLLPTGQIASVFWANAGTFLGALGFLAASVLTIPWIRLTRLV